MRASFVPEIGGEAHLPDGTSDTIADRMAEHALVLVTTGNAEEARAIARDLVEAKLAAGAQMFPIESVYRWQGSVVEDTEVVVLVKTRRDRFDAICSRVEELHSYEVPPILMLDIAAASQPYLDWIDHSV